jgi:hypothetical protein
MVNTPNTWKMFSLSTFFENLFFGRFTCFALLNLYTSLVVKQTGGSNCLLLIDKVRATDKTYI